MQNKKVVILIILSVFAAISLIHGLTARPKAISAPPAITAPGSMVPAQGILSVERRAKRSKFTSWKKSPFVPSGLPASSDLVLSGIIWNKDKPKAMIGDMIVSKGANIAGNTVVDIKSDRVILNDGTKDFELKMGK